MQKVLIAGATGLLGIPLHKHLEREGIDTITTGLSRNANAQCDFTKKDQVFSLLNNSKPNTIINLIASTNVDQCEINPQQAYLLNVKVAENIAEWISEKSPSTTLIQISTDQVYDGKGPFSEDDINLTNMYAFSKYAGEWPARSVNGVILRTNFFGISETEGRVSLSDWLFQSLLSKNNIDVFDDIYFTPLSIATLSSVIIQIINKQAVGTFNLGAHEGMSKADFAFSFAKHLKLDTHAMTRRQSNTSKQLIAYRPKDMRMDISKIEKALDIKLPTLEEEIKKVAEEYNEKI